MQAVCWPVGAYIGSAIAPHLAACCQLSSVGVCPQYAFLAALPYAPQSGALLRFRRLVQIGAIAPHPADCCQLSSVGVCPIRLPRCAAVRTAIWGTLVLPQVSVDRRNSTGGSAIAPHLLCHVLARLGSRISMQLPRLTSPFLASAALLCFRKISFFYIKKD